jgi:hypothetical protein
MSESKDSKPLPTESMLRAALLRLFQEFPNKSFANKEIEEYVVRELKISTEAQQIPREKSRTELQYRLAWARTKAKQQGQIRRSGSQSWISA